jgi:hypothetical protein
MHFFFLGEAQEPQQSPPDMQKIISQVTIT